MPYCSYPSTKHSFWAVFSVLIDVILTSFTFKGLHPSCLLNLFPDFLTLNHSRKIRLLVVQRIDLALVSLLSLMLLVCYIMKSIWAVEPDRISGFITIYLANSLIFLTQFFILKMGKIMPVSQGCEVYMSWYIKILVCSI